MKMLALAFALLATTAYAGEPVPQQYPMFYQPLDENYIPINTIAYYRYVDANLALMQLPCNNETLTLLKKSDEAYVMCINQKYNVVVK